MCLQAWVGLRSAQQRNMAGIYKSRLEKRPRHLLLTLSPSPDLKAHAHVGEANFTFSFGTALLFRVRWLSDSLGTGSVSVHDQHPQAETKRNPLWFNHREGQSLTWYPLRHRNQPASMCYAPILKGHNSDKTPSSWYQRKARASPCDLQI